MCQCGHKWYTLSLQIKTPSLGFPILHYPSAHLSCLHSYDSSSPRSCYKFRVYAWFHAHHLDSHAEISEMTPLPHLTRSYPLAGNRNVPQLSIILWACFSRVCLPCILGLKHEGPMKNSCWGKAAKIDRSESWGSMGVMCGKASQRDGRRKLTWQLNQLKIWVKMSRMRVRIQHLTECCSVTVNSERKIRILLVKG